MHLGPLHFTPKQVGPLHSFLLLLLLLASMADATSSPSSLTNISSRRNINGVPDEPTSVTSPSSLTNINGVPDEPTSLMSLPNDIMLIIIRRLGKISLESLVNAKATCTTIRDLGEHPYVVKSLSINQIVTHKVISFCFIPVSINKLEFQG